MSRIFSRSISTLSSRFVKCICKKKPKKNNEKCKETVGIFLVAGVGFEPTTFRLWAWRATGLLHPASKKNAVAERLGSDLLSHTLRCSTISAEGFNGRVRNGIGCWPLAITTKPFSYSSIDKWIDLKLLFQSSARHCLRIRPIKPIELLVSVSFTHYCASTPDLSTW